MTLRLHKRLSLCQRSNSKGHLVHSGNLGAMSCDPIRGETGSGLWILPHHRLQETGHPERLCLYLGHCPWPHGFFQKPPHPDLETPALPGPDVVSHSASTEKGVWVLQSNRTVLSRWGLGVHGDTPHSPQASLLQLLPSQAPGTASIKPPSRMSS